MDTLPHSMLSAQLDELAYLTPQLDMIGAPFGAGSQSGQLPSMKGEPFDLSFMGAFEDPTLPMDPNELFYSRPSRTSVSPPLRMNSNSFSQCGSSTQSTSPIQGQFSYMEFPPIQTTSNLETNLDSQPSPPSASASRKGSVDDNYRSERRRAQNRAAQRAYRQRKDQSLKEREHEIETLREELEKAHKLNQTLWKVVTVLRGRLKNPPPLTPP